MNQTTPPQDSPHKVEELSKQVIQFQKDTLAEWDNPAGRNVDMIKLAYKFSGELESLIHNREQQAELKLLEKALKAGDGKTWDAQMAGTCGFLGKRYQELKGVKND